MRIRFSGAIANYEDKKTKEFCQYEITSEPLVSEETGKPYVKAIVIYDSTKGHMEIHESLHLDLLWLLENCDMYVDKINIAETIKKSNPENNERQTIKIRYKNGLTEQLLYNADPLCNHIIQPQSAGGIKCRKCSGWYCA